MLCPMWAGERHHDRDDRREQGVTNGAMLAAALAVVLAAVALGFVLGGGSGGSHRNAVAVAQTGPASSSTSTTRRTTTTAHTTTTQRSTTTTVQSLPVSPPSRPPQVIYVPSPTTPITQPPELHTLAGTILISEGGGWTYRGPSDCSQLPRGGGELDDLSRGAPVTVRDASDVIVATGTIDSGKWTNIRNSVDGFMDADCLLHFTVQDVPRESFYTVEISHRGKQPYSFAQLSGSGWSISGLSLIVP